MLRKNFLYTILSAWLAYRLKKMIIVTITVNNGHVCYQSIISEVTCRRACVPIVPVHVQREQTLIIFIIIMRSVH